MSWQSGWIFWLLIPTLGLIVYSFLHPKKQLATMQFSSLKSLSSLTKTFRAQMAFLPNVLKSISLIVLLWGWARPQVSDVLVKKNVEGIDIMIALDVSDSMLIEDMVPTNRLEAAKDTLIQFVKGRISDRIGIVIFAGESFTLVPMTLDYDLLVSRVNEILTAHEAHIKDGTALGVALANAAGHLKESKAKSRVVIFLTDGENNSGTIDPETGLDIAKGYGVKIYSIGIGRDGPTKIPIYQMDIFGNKVKTYQPFESTVNEDLLTRMGSETGGKFFRAIKEDSLKGVFQEIDQLEKTNIDVNKFTRYTEKFPIFVWFSMILYLVSWVLSFTYFRRIP